jgi:hypothetical protein
MHHISPELPPPPPWNPAHTKNFNPSLLPSAVTVNYSLWLPTDTEPGQQRHVVVAPANDPELRPEMVNYLRVERIAQAGMREIFEEAGIPTYYRRREDPDTYPVPAVVHESAFVFPAQDPLLRGVNALVADFPAGTRFTMGTTEKPGKFKGLEWVPALAQRRILFSKEKPDLTHTAFQLSYFQHDVDLHIHAWLCIPPLITTKIFQVSSAATAEYEELLPTDENWTDAQWYFNRARLEGAKRQISNITGTLDLINNKQLDDMLRGEDESLTRHLSELLGGEAGIYKREILEHIADPRRENLLVAVA